MNMRRVVPIAYLVVTMATSVISNRGSDLCGDETGFNCFFKSNTEEFSDVRLQFDEPVPSYLSGTLIRNGPGLFDRGQQSVTHVFDGFAKPASWKIFPDGTMFFSTHFVRSKSYQKTMKRDRLAPYILFSAPDPKYTVTERAMCLINGMDNMNVNILDFPGKSNSKNFAVLSDAWKLYQISGTDLSTIKNIKPKLKRKRFAYYLDLLSSAHPLPEPGTTNRLTFLIRERTLPFMTSRLVLFRMSSVSKRTKIAEWKIKGKTPYMHSFSVTETKVVMLAAPYFSTTSCILKEAAPLSCMNWDADTSSTLFIANFKTGKKLTIKMPTIFALHHINAYDLNDDEIIMDVTSYDSAETVNKMLLIDVISSPAKRAVYHRPPTNKRIYINLKTKITTTTYMNTTSAIGGGLDMPAINEEYRSRRYCYVYGNNAFDDGVNYISFALLKKDMCNGGIVVGSVVIPRHYPSEPWFVPKPGGTTEDDGLLLAPFLRGEDAVTYLAVIDAKTMTIISKADLPTYIPFSFHGRFFKDYF